MEGNLKEYEQKYENYISELHQIIQEIKKSLDNPSFSKARKNAILFSNLISVLEKEKQSLEINHEKVLMNPNFYCTIIFDFFRDISSKRDNLILIKKYFLGIYE